MSVIVYSNIAGNGCFLMYGADSDQADMAELADALDLGSCAWLAKISGYGGIGRRDRFRFYCQQTCRFKSCYPQYLRGKTKIFL